MKHIALLGFGVVGCGVANLIVENQRELSSLIGEEIVIDSILDLRDFPASPFCDKIVHDFNSVLHGEADTVIEAMGGEHPAYEYIKACLRAGKNVITSNKEVVALHLDEFLSLAEENGVVFRFEASVGGGIPIISPLISLLRHNKIDEVRGILNGTTNYILTKMFTYGESFENALMDAQEKGYAERIPDADVLGTDAARKISILASLVSESLVDVKEVYTEGIVSIRKEDIHRLAKDKYTIKLVGRAILGESPTVFVSPHVIAESCPLYGVSGVYNAVEVLARPLGNIMLYGQGAGAGATASAMVSDLTLTYLEGRHYAIPKISQGATLSPFDALRLRFYIVMEKESAVSLPDTYLCIEDGEDEIAYFTDYTTYSELKDILKGSKMLTILPILE